MSSDITRREFLAASAAGVAISLAPIGGAEAASGTDYSQYPRIKGLSIPSAVTVVGCGGFGAWPALLAALAGVRKIHLIDMADVSRLDLARAPFFPRDVGKPKSRALKNVILAFRPSANVISVKKRISLDDADDLQGFVFDGTNDMELAERLPVLLKKRNQGYVTGYYSGAEFGVATEHPSGLKFTTGSEVPVWIGSAAASGVLALNAAMLSPFDFFGSASSLAMDKSSMSLAFVDRIVDK